MRDCSNSASSRTLGAGAGIRNVGGGGGGRGGTGSSRSKKSSQAPPSVTSVVFIDEYVLASAGANDGAVKLWDLRKSWNHEVPCVVTVRL
jgi:WD40 repeat protein